MRNQGSQAPGQGMILLVFLDPVCLPGRGPYFLPSSLAPDASCLAFCPPFPASEPHSLTPSPSPPDHGTGAESLEVLTKSVYYWQQDKQQEGGSLLRLPRPPRQLSSRSSTW